MSPEAIMDSGTSSEGQLMRCGRPSDIWSLGCILYQMLYGRPPFAHLHVVPKLQAIVNPNHAIKYGPADEAAIDAVRQCLEREPRNRAPIIGPSGLLNHHRFLQNSCAPQSNCGIHLTIWNHHHHHHQNYSKSQY